MPWKYVGAKDKFNGLIFEGEGGRLYTGDLHLGGKILQLAIC